MTAQAVAVALTKTANGADRYLHRPDYYLEEERRGKSSTRTRPHAAVESCARARARARARANPVIPSTHHAHTDRTQCM